MVNSIINAVTKQLGTTFGDSYHYYVENIEQGLQKPCFTVDTIIPLQRSKSPVLYDRTMPMVVHYFSGSTTNVKKECYGIAEQAVECLEYLPFMNTIVRGEDISWRVEDDVLQIFVTYEFTTKRVIETEEPSIETFESNVTHAQ